MANMNNVHDKVYYLLCEKAIDVIYDTNYNAVKQTTSFVFRHLNGIINSVFLIIEDNWKRYE